jgi:GAF domain-containing protein
LTIPPARDTDRRPPAEDAIVTPDQQADVLARIDRALADAADRDIAAARCVAILADRLPHFKWTGVYWLPGDVLVLGPYVGAPTDHREIPVGRGVCGTAVAQGRNQVVADVRAEANYLACSAETRAEIVVLIRDARGRIVGQIDVDGHEAHAFDGSDEALLSAVAARIAARPPVVPPLPSPVP